MALFEKLASRVEQRANDAATVIIDRAAAAYAAVPGVVAKREGDTLVIEARGLVRRWISDMKLRFALWGPSTSYAGPPPSAGIPAALLGSWSLEAGSARAGEDLR